MDTFDAVITAKIARGTLPRGVHDNTSLGRGNGEPCDGCDTLVLEADTEVGVGFSQGRTLRFHLECFGVWRVAARAAIGPIEQLSRANTRPRAALRLRA